MNIGKRIRKLRKNQKLTIEQIANITGLSQPFISEIERSLKTASLETVTKICSALGITMSEFFAESEPEMPTHIRELLNVTKNLAPNQVDALNHFIRSITEPSATTSQSENYYDPTGNLADHRMGVPIDNPPPVTWDSIREFKQSYTQETKNKNKK